MMIKIKRWINQWFMMLILILSGYLLTACQSTPEEAVVVQKDNTEQTVLESAKNEETEIEPCEAPEHVEERFTVIEGVLDVSIDADVELPDVDAFPVASVKSAPFTQDQADTMREYFVQDGRLVSEYVRTKADYDALIVKARRGHKEDGEYVFNESDQKWVNELIERREDAPEEDTSAQITDFSIDGSGLRGRIIRNGIEYGHLFINEKMIYVGSNQEYWLESETYYDINDQPLELTPCEIDMTETEAIEAAEKILSDLGIDGMAIKEMDRAYYYDVETGREYEVDHGGYYFIFMRTFGGLMPMNVEGFCMSDNDQFEVSPPATMEMLTLAIEENGDVAAFSWQNPAEITGTLTEHVDILAFEDIMERFEEFAKLQYSYMEDYIMEGLWVKKVYKIGLYLNYLPIKNNPSEFMFAPCWYFIYKDSEEYTEEQLADFEKRGYPPEGDDLMGDAYLIFSAVDGASVSVYSATAVNEMLEWEALEEEWQ